MGRFLSRRHLTQWGVVFISCSLVISVFSPLLRASAVGLSAWSAGVPTAIASGLTHTCAITSGQVYCWGSNTRGELGDGTTTASTQPVLAGGELIGKTVTAVTAGSNFSCAIADGAAYCWGFNNKGQLGINSTTLQKSPVAVTTAVGVLSGKTVTAISAGASHACAVASGAVYCWGLNNYGQLGNNSTTQQKAPVAVTMASGALAGTTAVDVTTGTSHTCAVASGAVYCWGLNNYGQLGNGTTTQSTSPVAVTMASGVLAGTTATTIHAGTYHSCVLASGAVYCWGLGTSGQLGNNAVANSSSPVAVYTNFYLTGLTVTSLSSGSLHNCLVASGNTYCWGSGANGRLGSGYTTSLRAPSPVATTAEMGQDTSNKVSAGGSHSCTVAGSSVYCWGLNTSGQLGDTTNVQRLTPRLVRTTASLQTSDSQFYQNANSTTPGASLGLANAPATLSSAGQAFRLRTGVSNGTTTGASIIVGGGLSTCALVNGTVYCWGGNDDGQLGNGSTTQSLSPTPITATGALAGKNVTGLAASNYGTCALAAGQVFCWGLNADGNLGNGTTTSANVPTAVDMSGALSGKTVSAIASSGGNICALANGQAYCWGANGFGQLGNGSLATNSTIPVAVTTSGVLSGKYLTELSGGKDQMCAADSTGKVYCWGNNATGQLGNNSTTKSNVPVAVTSTGILSGKNVTSISGGDGWTCVIASGAPYCWGLNSYGQLGNYSTTNSLTPVAVYTDGALAGKAITALGAANDGACVIGSGQVYCWGGGGGGDLGNGSLNDSVVPVAVSTSGVLAGATVSNLSNNGSSNFNVCVIASTGVACWGYNDYGQLGNNSTSRSAAPVDTGLRPGPLLKSGENSFKLQVAALSADSCVAQNTGFTDVSASTAIAYNTNSSVANGTAISALSTDPVPTDISAPQSYISAPGNFTTNDIVSGKTAEWDFSLVDNSGLPQTSYCLQIAYADGTQIEQETSFPQIKTAAVALSADIVDSTGTTVASPTYSFSQAYLKTTCQTIGGTLGTTNARMRVTNFAATSGWVASLAPTMGSSALWTRADSAAQYDFNDSGGAPAGCGGGSDGDIYAGQLSLNTASATITPQSGCSSTGITKGTPSAYKNGIVDAITLMSGSSTSATNCYFDLTGVGMSQTIPGSQAAGSYTLPMTLTVVAQ